MDVELSGIIEKIKTEGIEQGKKKADEELAQARKEAEQIVSKAKHDAQAIIAHANQQAESILQRGEDALKQAQRDVILLTREKLCELLSSVVQQKLSESLKPDALLELIKIVFSKWDLTSNDQIFLSLSEEDAKKITAESFAELIPTGGAQLEIKIDEQLSHGFLVSRDVSGALQYDFSDRAIESALLQFLTGKIREILNK